MPCGGLNQLHEEYALFCTNLSKGLFEMEIMFRMFRALIFV